MLAETWRRDTIAAPEEADVQFEMEILELEREVADDGMEMAVVFVTSLEMFPSNSQLVMIVSALEQFSNWMCSIEGTGSVSRLKLESTRTVKEQLSICKIGREDWIAMDPGHVLKMESVM